MRHEAVFTPKRREGYGLAHRGQGEAIWPVGYGILKGTDINDVGSTGNSSGPHLHFATWRLSTSLGATDEAFAGNSINPQLFYPNIAFTGYTSSVIY